MKSKITWKLFWPVVLLVLGLLTACNEVNSSPTTAPVSPTAGPTSLQTTGSTSRQLSPTPGQTRLTTTTATITRANGSKQVMTIELARTSQEQETGLMGRSSLPPDWGMLFIFKEPGLVGFWMKDTPLALSIAFIEPGGKIVDIQDMAPFSQDTHVPGQKYIYALEVPQGYFASKGIKAGDQFSFQAPTN